MANFDKKSLGTASGGIGDIVFKTRYGRTYVASKPTGYKTSMSEKAVTNRDKFSLGHRLFCTMGKVYWFKQIWKSSAIEGDTYVNKMCKVNYSRIDDDLDYSKIMLLPVEEHFNAEVVNYSFQNKILSVEVSIPEPASASLNNKKISLQGVIHLKDAIDQAIRPFDFLAVTTDDIYYHNTEPLIFSIPLKEAKFSNFFNYSKHSVFVNLLSKGQEGNPEEVSVNLYFHLD